MKIREKNRNIIINETVSIFLEIINKMNKSIDTLIKQKNRKTQIKNIKSERGDIFTNSPNIYKIKHRNIMKILMAINEKLRRNEYFLTTNYQN